MTFEIKVAQVQTPQKFDKRLRWLTAPLIAF